MPASKRRLMAVGSKMFGVLLCAWLPLSAAQAADVAAGQAKSVQCAACHGAKGMATLPEAPNLAGQNAIYLVKALNDFKSGARKDEMMSLMAAGLSDADIENLAAFYESQGAKP